VKLHLVLARAPLLLLAVAVTAPPAHAADDVIAFYTDASMTSCELVDQAPALVQIHMFHTGTLPTAFVGFYAAPPACWTGATWLGDIVNPAFRVGSNTQASTGIVIIYTGCLTPPQYLGYMNFAMAGAGQACCMYGASDPPNENDDLSAFGCSTTAPEERPAIARPIVINPDASCPCVSPVAVEETTWGKVKALYAE